MKYILTAFISLICYAAEAQETSLLIPYRKGDKFGYVNEKGEIKIPFRYKDAGLFFGGMAWVKKNKKYGYINTQGKMAIRPKYIVAGNFSDGKAEVKRRPDKSFEINRKGRKVITIECYSGMSHNTPNPSFLGCFKKNGKFGILNRETGDTLVVPKYDSALIPHNVNGYVLVSNNKKWGLVFLDTEVVQPKYDRTGFFINPLFYGDIETELTWVELDGLTGWINKKGEEVIKAEYEEADGYSVNGLARVKYNGKWGYIDNTGRKYFE